MAFVLTVVIFKIFASIYINNIKHQEILPRNIKISLMSILFKTTKVLRPGTLGTATQRIRGHGPGPTTDKMCDPDSSLGLSVEGRMA